MSSVVGGVVSSVVGGDVVPEVVGGAVVGAAVVGLVPGRRVVGVDGRRVVGVDDRTVVTGPATTPGSATVVDVVEDVEDVELLDVDVVTRRDVVVSRAGTEGSDTSSAGPSSRAAHPTPINTIPILNSRPIRPFTTITINHQIKNI